MVGRMSAPPRQVIFHNGMSFTEWLPEVDKAFAAEHASRGLWHCYVPCLLEMKASGAYYHTMAEEAKTLYLQLR